MSFSIFRSFQTRIGSLAKNALTQNSNFGSRGIHQICSQYSSTLNTTNQQNSCKFTNHFSSILTPSSFLAPTLPLYNQVCGLKVKGNLLKRCKGCYFVSRKGLLYVMCKLKPRHKQVQMHKSFQNTRILTFAHQKPKRDW